MPGLEMDGPVTGETEYLKILLKKTFDTVLISC